MQLRRMVLWVGLLGLLLAACTTEPSRPGIPIDYDREFYAQLADVRETGQSVALSEITDFN